MDGHSDPSLRAFAQTVTQVGGWVKHPTAVVHPSTIVMPGAYVGPRVHIAARCVVGPNAVIGGPGFGYEQQADGSQTYREHVFGVVLGEDVHVGACTTIDAGRHRTTVIGRGTRIDNLVHIAHNVIVGQDCLIIAHAMLAGSVQVGDGVTISPGATVRDWRKIGDAAHVGLAANVVKDVAAGAVVAGNPARERRCES